ncbi:MAG: histidine kinase [Anaerolineales bacterium]|nr:histidine kinase [Anaerolineales bacterium]
MVKFWSTFLDQFSRLRWRLTFSYFGVTIFALLMAEIIGIMGISIWVVTEARVSKEELIQELSSSNVNTFDDQRLAEKLNIDKLSISLGEYISVGSRFLSSSPPNTQGLAQFLSIFSATVVDIKPIELGNFIINASNTNILSILYLDTEGNLIDSLPHSFFEGIQPGDKINPDLIPGLAGPLQQALYGSRNYDTLVQRMGENVIVGVVPIPDEKVPFKTVGFLAFEHKSRITEILQWDKVSRQILFSLVFITGLAGLFGIIFGFLTARFLTARLDRVTTSARAWSQGNFTVLVDDTSKDELAELSHTLNNMAVQMDNLLDERQEISIMEERNRLARELHDSVKQQAFAASAQLAAAHSLYSQDPEGAAKNLFEAERLVDDVRRELTNLIHELRPAALKGEGLVKAARQLAAEMENMLSIPILVRVQGERTIPLEIEQTLFRILQGALSNIARHSFAKTVEIHLNYGRSQIMASIADDGVGFHPADQSYGIGLKSIQERVDLIDGSMEIISQPGAGTTLIIRAPINSLT